ncbi:unnamed protein product [Ceratitis capitata]|uniref:(Mediterranean fruit fly) hypothetical protein n=1 Tax=Ceratitis capitata TaxID=7213 RepID=A0A811UIP4_CERCA|nr:unnamed protein product [Ceratitis capitata]
MLLNTVLSSWQIPCELLFSTAREHAVFKTLVFFFISKEISEHMRIELINISKFFGSKYSPPQPTAQRRHHGLEGSSFTLSASVKDDNQRKLTAGNNSN